MYRIAVNGSSANTETLSSSNGFGIGLNSNTGNSLIKATNSFSLINANAPARIPVPHSYVRRTELGALTMPVSIISWNDEPQDVQ